MQLLPILVTRIDASAMLVETPFGTVATSIVKYTFTMLWGLGKNVLSR